MSDLPSLDDLLAAMARVRPHVHRTPVMTSSTLDRMTGGQLHFKCENLQKIGAFKIRGATNFMRSMPPAALQKGVVTHSSGNHAQAVAKTAQDLGIPAYIVMPSNAPAVKIAAVKGYGARVTLCEPTLAARVSTARDIMERTGATFVHPYEDSRIFLGQSTCAQELIEDHGQSEPFDLLLCPVGGGGLLAGTALAAHYFSPGTRVIATEPAGADDAFRSFHGRHRVPSENPRTIGDGLLTSVGEINFRIMVDYVSDVVTCSERGILQAMRLIWERMKIVVEPSSAVPLACILEGKVDVRDQKVGIILTGGNLDLDSFFDGLMKGIATA